MDHLFGLDDVAPHDEDLSLAGTYFENASLLLARSLLEDAGIPYLCRDRGAGSAVRVIAGYSLFGTDLFVKNEDLDRALSLLSPEDGTESGEEEETGETDEGTDE